MSEDIMKLKNSSSMTELKEIYRRLAFILHPDRGGSTEEMQELNSIYSECFTRFKNSMDKESKEYTSVKHEVPNDLIDILSKIIHIDGLIIEVVGSWVWIDKNEVTWEYREYLKEIGFQWSKARRKLYFAKGFEKTGYYKKKSFQEIRENYGSQRIEGVKADRLD